jgi:6-pyruvoyl-tetrahydropterin synthase
MREPVHGHNWRTVVRIDGDGLDGDGFVADFHAVEAALHDVVRPLRNVHLNEVPPFDVVNPSAELVAKHIFDCLGQRLQKVLPSSAWVGQVRVTEAAGCVAIVTHERSRGMV